MTGEEVQNYDKITCNTCEYVEQEDGLRWCVWYTAPCQEAELYCIFIDAIQEV